MYMRWCQVPPLFLAQSIYIAEKSFLADNGENSIMSYRGSWNRVLPFFLIGSTCHGEHRTEQVRCDVDWLPCDEPCGNLLVRRLFHLLLHCNSMIRNVVIITANSTATMFRIGANLSNRMDWNPSFLPLRAKFQTLVCFHTCLLLAVSPIRFVPSLHSNLFQKASWMRPSLSWTLPSQRLSSLRFSTPMYS